MWVGLAVYGLINPPPHWRPPTFRVVVFAMLVLTHLALSFTAMFALMRLKRWSRYLVLALNGSWIAFYAWTIAEGVDQSPWAALAAILILVVVVLVMFQRNVKALMIN